MDYTKKQDDNMTIWQFDKTTQDTVNKQITIEIVKLSNCHDENFVEYHST